MEPDRRRQARAARRRSSSWTRATTSTTPSAATSGSSRSSGSIRARSSSILSATVGHPERFCHWVELTRRVPMELVESRERKVPLVHEFREEYLIDTVRELAHTGDVPAIVFVFGREQCFEVARLLKSCRRFTTDEEKAKIEALCDEALLPAGVREGAAAAARARHRHPPRRHPAALQAAGRAARARAPDQVRGLDRDDRRRASTCRRAPWCSRRCASSSRRQPRLVTAGRVPPDGGARRAAAVRRPRASRSRSRPRRSSASSRRSSRTRRSAAGVRRGEDQEVDLQPRAQRRAAQGRHLWTPEVHAELVERRAGGAAQQDQDHRRAGARDRAARSRGTQRCPAQLAERGGASAMARGRGVAAAVDAARHRHRDRQPAARRPRARASCTRCSRSWSPTCARSA